jgi:hypothetical protein
MKAAGKSAQAVSTPMPAGQTPAAATPAA